MSSSQTRSLGLGLSWVHAEANLQASLSFKCVQTGMKQREALRQFSLTATSVGAAAAEAHRECGLRLFRMQWIVGVKNMYSEFALLHDDMPNDLLGFATSFTLCNFPWTRHLSVMTIM